MSFDDPTTLELTRCRALRKLRGRYTWSEMAKMTAIPIAEVRRLCREFSLPYYGDTPGEYDVSERDRLVADAMADKMLAEEVAAARAERARVPPLKKGPLVW